MLECDVFVIGCGPAGASLAWYLTQKNIKVIVAEKKKTLDIPVRCAGFVPVNIAGLFDFKISGINNRTEYLETYAAKNSLEKFRLISRTVAPGFILDRDIFINDIAIRFTTAGGRLLKGTKVISVQQSADGFTLDLLDVCSKNHLMVKARIIAGADGPLSLIGSLTGSANKSFVAAIQQNPEAALNSIDCNKVFFSPYISCGYGWLFPKIESVNLGIGASLERKTIHSYGFGRGSGDSGKSGLCKDSGLGLDSGNYCLNSGSYNSGLSRNSYYSGSSRDLCNSGIGSGYGSSGISIKNILAVFTRHLEFSGIFTGNMHLRQSVFNNNNKIGGINNKENIYPLLPAENKNVIKQVKSLEAGNQFTPAVTGLLPDSGIVENRGLKEGYVLCGDAAGLCNPITGAGIYNAIYSAKLASESIAKSLNLNDLSILQEINEIYNNQFGNSINRALRKKLMQKNNWPQPAPDAQNRNGFDYKDTIKFSDLISKTWISFRDYWQ